jgi:quercetin dioxygenase-like cupin family protein
MNIRMIMSSALAPGAVSLRTAEAQQPDIQRSDLVRSDFSVSGKEVVQVRVEFNPGAVAASHRHPDEQVAFVLEGTLEYQLEDRQPVTLQAGQSLFIPSGTPHTARNVGGGKATELATCILSKGFALVEPVTQTPFRRG